MTYTLALIHCLMYHPVTKRSAFFPKQFSCSWKYTVYEEAELRVLESIQRHRLGHRRAS